MNRVDRCTKLLFKIGNVHDRVSHHNQPTMASGRGLTCCKWISKPNEYLHYFIIVIKFAMSCDTEAHAYRLSICQDRSNPGMLQHSSLYPIEISRNKKLKSFIPHTVKMEFCHWIDDIHIICCVCVWHSAHSMKRNNISSWLFVCNLKSLSK